MRKCTSATPTRCKAFGRPVYHSGATCELCGTALPPIQRTEPATDGALDLSILHRSLAKAMARREFWEAEERRINERIAELMMLQKLGETWEIE